MIVVVYNIDLQYHIVFIHNNIHDVCRTFWGMGGVHMDITILAPPSHLHPPITKINGMDRDTWEREGYALWKAVSCQILERHLMRSKDTVALSFKMWPQYLPLTF